MVYNSVLDEVIGGLQPEDIPSGYILMAKITDQFGHERVIRGVDLDRFLNDPNRAQGVAEARVIIDVRRIRVAIATSINVFFEELNLLIAELPPLIPEDEN